MSPISRMLKVRVTSPIWSGLIWSSIWLAVAALLLSALLSSGAVQESEMLVWVFGAHGVSALAGGFVAARRSGRKGWYFGGICGGVYAMLITLASFLAMDSQWSIRLAVLLGIALLAGAFGGMVGVNTSRTSNHS